MADLPDALKEKAKKLLSNAGNTGVAPLALRRGNPADPASPLLLTVAIDQPSVYAGTGVMDSHATGFAALTPDMAQQVRWALDELEKAPELKGRIDIRIVSDPYADIGIVQANTLGHGGGTSGWVDPQGRLHKEIWLNPATHAWMHPERYTPNDPSSSKNPHGFAAKLVKHEIGHALGLTHPPGGQDTDETLMSTGVGANNQGKSRNYVYRPLELAALAALYAPETGLKAVDADMRDAPAVAVFTQEAPVAVTASEAAGHSLLNRGAGGMVIRMTQEQYASRRIGQHMQDGHLYYSLTFRDTGGKEKVTHLPAHTKLTVQRDGNPELAMDIAEAYKNSRLAAALEKASGKLATLSDHNAITVAPATPVNRTASPGR